MKIALNAGLVLFLLAGELFAQGPEAVEPPLPSGAAARLGTLRLRHSGEGYSIVFSPDGKSLAVASQNAGEVFLFDADSGRRMRILRPSGEVRVLGLAYSPDGASLAVQLMDSRILLFDPVSGKEARSFKITIKNNDLEHLDNGCLAYSADGKSLAVVRGANFYILESAMGKELFRHEGRAGIQELAFSPDGKHLALGTIEPGGQIWDLETKKSIHDLKAQKISMCVAYSPDGKWLATGASEVIVWNAETGKEEHRLSGSGPEDIFMKLAFTPDGKRLVAGSQEGAVYEWDLKTQAQTQKLDGKMFVLRSIALSPDGAKIAASFAFNAVRLWDRKTGKMLLADIPGHPAPVETVAFSPDGRKLVTGSANRSIHLWEMPSARHQKSLESPNSASMAAFSPDGKFLITGWKWDRKIHVWNAATGERIRELVLPGSRTKGIAFAADGKEIVALSTATRNAPASLTRWKTETGEQILNTEHTGSYFNNCLAVSPDGKWAAFAREGEIQLCSLRTGKVIRQMSGHNNYNVQTLQFTPDGSCLVSGALDQAVCVWEMATGQKILLLTGHKRAVTSVAVSPDGRTIASGSGADHFPIETDAPRRIRYWDLFTGKELAHHAGHDENVFSLAFSPDGKLLATGLRDTTTLLWHVPEAVRNRTLDEKTLTEAELVKAWDDLKNADAEKAWQAMALLTSGGVGSVGFLRTHLKRIEELDAQATNAILQKLDDDDFTVRSEAEEQIRKLGNLAEEALEKFAENASSLEAKKRSRALLDELESPWIADPTRLRNIRAIQVLGRIATPEARKLLENLAEGAARARETREAKRRLDWLDRSAR